MKNTILITFALIVSLINGLSAKVNTTALDYTSCNWSSMFEYPKKHSYNYGEDVYVKVKPQKHYDINYMEIWVNNKYIRKESQYPYEWGKPGSNGDQYLKNLNPGTYKIKCKIVDKCGQHHYIYYDFEVKGNYGNTCNYKSWFKYPQNNKHYNYGCDMYVRVDCQKYQDVEYMELYLNNQYIRKESQYPFEWCKGSGNSDYKLRNLKKGCYHLKMKMKDKCGNYHEQECTFYVD